MILVVGATGMLGGEICRRLREQGQAVRGLVRPNSSKAAQLVHLGVEAVPGDLKRPDTLGAACRGVSAVITTANSILSRRPGDNLRSVDRSGQIALVGAAVQAGVEKFVYVSVSPHLSSRTEFVHCKRQVEAVIRASGMAWTILQPSVFMEICFSPLAGFDPEAARAVVIGRGGEPSSFVSMRDVAHFAVLAMERPELAHRDLPIGGPEPMTPLDAVRIFEDAFGRRFKVTHAPVAVIRAMSFLLQPVNPFLASIMGMAAEAATRGDVIDMSGTVREFSLKLTSVGEYARALSRGDLRP